MRKLGMAMALCVVAMMAQVHAQTAKSIAEEYDTALKGAQTITAFGPDLFGESVNLKDGATAFSAVDVSVRTNSGLPVSVGRTLALNSRDYDRFTDPVADSELFGGWKLDVPVMSGVYDDRTGWAVAGATPQQRCSGGLLPPTVSSAYPGWNTVYFPSQYWRGVQISIPGKGQYPLLSLPTDAPRPGDGQPYRATTSSHWRIRCTASLKNGTGEGFVAVLPDGTRYTFDWISSRKVAALRDTTCYTTYDNRYSVNNWDEHWVTVNVRDREGHYHSERRLEPSGGSFSGGSEQIQSCTEQTVVNRREYFLHATLVEDRFGNWVKYNYDPANPRRLLSIVSNDGAAITLTYNSGGKITSVVANNRTWQYEYTNGELSAVVLPDNSRWTFLYGDLYWLTQSKLAWADCEPVDPSPTRTESIVIGHPSGAVGTFTFRKMVHGYDRTPGGCYQPNPEQPLRVELSEQVKAYKVASLVSKQVSGPGMAAETWSYAYQPSWSWNPDGYIDDCTHTYVDCTKTSTSEVTAPDGTITRSVFGNDYYRNAGLLLRVDTLRNGTVVQSASSTYLTDPASQAYPSQIGYDPNNRDNPYETERLRPLRRTDLVRDGATFTWEVIPCSGATYCFDAFARPTAVKRWNTLGYSRVDVTDYQDNFDLWVLGQIKRQYNADTLTVTEQTEYNAQAMPWKVYAYGKLQSVLTYAADGLLANVANGRGNITTVSDWKRGIPRRIQYPATSEAPEGAAEYAAVDDNGWITSTTDEVGYVTGYAYDGMGRIAGIGYPTNDVVAWAPKGFEFRPLTSADWMPAGIVAGQWRRYEGQGNYAKFTYYDAQWRPVLVQEYDTSNAAATIRYTRTAYDSLGRVAFQSYPVADPATATTGTRTAYDALDRVLRVEQDSELGTLATISEYLPGLQVRVTNPRGQQTTTRFMAWDTPGYELPVRSDQPEGKVVEIVRDPYFGWPRRLTQRSADSATSISRLYVYNGAAQLCKTIEPETGATVMHYDDAGNLDWSAAGLNLPNPDACDDTAGGIAARRVARGYDARSRLTTLAFPDGRGDQIWTYTRDGLPATITTYNGAGQTQPVVNAYQYNSLRQLNGQGEYLSQPGYYVWGTGYGYDANGHLKTQRYPTGLIVDYAPNALGQPTQAGSFASGAQYFPNGALKQFAYGNGIVHTMTQNARQLPARSLDSGNVLDFSYGYDGNANPVQILDGVTGTPTARSRWMTYDGLDRLTTAASAVFGGNDHTHRFAYDAVDNLKSWKLAGVKDYADYVYDAQQRLTGIRDSGGATVTAMSYDAQGNLASKDGQSYDFDYGNRLRNVPGKEWYQYDGLGRRVKTGKTSGVVVLWQYNRDGQLLYEEDGTTQFATEHVYLAGSVIANRERNWSSNAVQVKYQHTDALGSPVAVTNEAGAVIERNDYEPYGAIIGKPTRSGIGYTGHVMDGATGLTYMQQRYYDPSVGRFLSVDPVVPSINTGTNFSRYWYGNDEPYKYLDPDGRKGFVGWIVKLGANSMRKLARVGREDAARAVRSGKDVLVSSRREAARIAKAGSGGKGVVEDVGHKLKDGSTGLPHFHTADRNGSHVFYETLSTVVLLPVADFLDKASDAADGANPFDALTHVSDAGPEFECGSVCRAQSQKIEKISRP